MLTARSPGGTGTYLGCWRRCADRQLAWWDWPPFRLLHGLLEQSGLLRCCARGADASLPVGTAPVLIYCMACRSSMAWSAGFAVLTASLCGGVALSPLLFQPALGLAVDLLCSWGH